MIQKLNLIQTEFDLETGVGRNLYRAEVDKYTEVSDRTYVTTNKDGVSLNFELPHDENVYDTEYEMWEHVSDGKLVRTIVYDPWRYEEEMSHYLYE